MKRRFMAQSSDKQPTKFSDRVVDNFRNSKFSLTVESYETTWGFRSTSGKYFKLSNRDIAVALRDITANWDEWSSRDLHINTENPDSTLIDFSTRCFSTGAHKDLAEVQRRGFLHLINSIAHASRHNEPFDATEGSKPLEKDDYRAALDLIRDYSEAAEKLAIQDTEKLSGAEDAKEKGNSPEETSERKTGGDNILFYGAPGTGKSYEVWQKIEAADGSSFITVFHPDMQNSDFTGTLKPGVDEEGNVTYAFRPGPFARAVAEAWANPGKEVYLVIEELNRAVAAAVFGELFQLLDREPDGSSSYQVDFPSPEFEQWFHAETHVQEKRLSLPSNLWILATMNSADQGVYPLDTAFRRRWNQNYLAINYAKAPDAEVSYVSHSRAKTVSWRIFVETLNGFLISKLSINEDRLIGPHFVNTHDLDNGQLPGKLLIYLWDDLLRHQTEKALFASDIKTYGELDRRIKDRKIAFSEEFLALLDRANGTAGDEVTDDLI